MQHITKCVLSIGILCAIGGYQTLSAYDETSSNPGFQWNYGTLENPIYTFASQLPAFVGSWNYGTLDMPVWFSFGSQSSNSNDANSYTDTIQNTPSQQTIIYDILDTSVYSAVTRMLSIGSDSSSNSGWNYGTLENPIYTFASQLPAFVGSWNYGTLDMPVWFSFGSQSSNSNDANSYTDTIQNTPSQQITAYGITNNSTTQKCPVKETDFGKPTGAGSGLVSTTGSQVKVEYALYDTCGTSLQGTREERLAFDAVVGEGTIPGFAQAMVGMQAGQNREFTLSPKDAYGEEFIDIPVNREIVQGTIVRPMDSKLYTDNEPITESLGLSVDMTKIQVGNTYPSSIDPKLFMKVTAINGDKVTYILDTSRLPFYKKLIAVGTKVSQDGINYEIVSMSGSVMTVSEKIPDTAIFSDNEIKIGAKKKLTEKSLYLLSRFGLKADDEVEIVDIIGGEEEVVLRIPNKQELAGKSLVFSIKMVSVSK